MTAKPRPTVLLVEDNPGDILLARKAFERTGYDCAIDVVTDGEQALEHLRNGRQSPEATLPALVLLDINLPRLSGLDVLKEIKQDPTLRHIPVVMLTSSQRDTDVRCAYENHANSYVSKPSKMAELIELLDQIQRYWLTVVEPWPQTNP